MTPLRAGVLLKSHRGSHMSDFLVVVLIAAFAAFLTWLGAPIAEKFDVPQKVVSGALQFAAGVITALVFLSLIPGVRSGNLVVLALMFFIGGALFVFFEYFSAKRQAGRQAQQEQMQSVSIGLYVGILVDLFVDGAVIGIGSTMDLGTGIALALGMAISTLPLAFVTISTAKQQGISKHRRQQLGALFFVCMLAGAVLGFLVLQNQPDSVRGALIALACGFLTTTVTQSMIPEANKNGEPSFAGIFFVAGISIYALLSLVLS
jgi:ZIP family zinc transporter